jgi:hypothetical protein
MDIRHYLTGAEEKAKGINRALGTAVWPHDNAIAGLPGSEIQSVVSVVRKATLAGDWSPKDRQPSEPLLATIHKLKNIEPIIDKLMTERSLIYMDFFASSPAIVAI